MYNLIMDELPQEVENNSSSPSIVQSKPFYNNLKFWFLFLVFVLAVLIVSKTVLRNKVISNVKIDTSSVLVPSVEVIAELPNGYKFIEENVRYNPFTDLYAYSLDENKYTSSSSATIIVNGIKGNTYDQIDDITLSPDGKRVAFVATKNKKMFVVVDGKEAKYYDFAGDISFSPDSRQVAYVAGEGRNLVEGVGYFTTNSFLVIDDKEGRRYDGISIESNSNDTNRPIFSHDGSSVAYTANKNKKQIIVVDGKEYSSYDSQFSPRFMGNSNEIAYLAGGNKKYFVVEAGKQKPPHVYVDGIALFSVDNGITKVTYTTDDGPKKYTLVVNDDVYQLPEEFVQSLNFSHSGNYFAYFNGVANGVMCNPECTRSRLYLNGNESLPVTRDNHTTLSSLTFSPDEKLLVYAEETNQSLDSVLGVKLYVFSVNLFKKLKTIDLPGYSGVGDFKFSDDSKRLYFKGIQNKNLLIDTLDLSSL
jgi:Tol biopolymer transport system component